MIQLLNGNEFVQLNVVGKKRLLRREAVLEQARDKRIRQEVVGIGPVLRVEVAVEQKFRERKEAERHRMRQYFPFFLDRDGLTHGIEIGKRNELVVGGEGWEIESEIRFEFGGERKVFLNILVPTFQPEAIRRAAAHKLDRQENQRCVARRVVFLEFEPFELPNREVEDV